ncbi:uncharacterized protein V2V93DRAFT_374158 [Kockiozyma suomiensis]|uniref:uncharacterized protein n=1 Tax=Kockiozyma suomiensis TaxID=1337062 RepID=UPI003343210A
MSDKKVTASEPNSQEEVLELAQNGEAVSKTEDVATQDGAKEAEPEQAQAGEQIELASTKTGDASATEHPSKKIISDPSTLPVTSDHSLILKQVEFYFSDQNLPRDKFLWKATTSNDGWVPISTIANFARMRRFQPFDEVVAALRESKELLEVDAEGANVRRKVPLNAPAPDTKKQIDLSSVYVEGFGDETSTSQFDIESFFEKLSGAVRQVRLLRNSSKKFEGAVLVEFAAPDAAAKFVASQSDLKYGECQLKILSKEDYLSSKGGKPGYTFGRFNAFSTEKRKRKSDEEENESAEKQSKTGSGRAGRGRGRGGRGRGGRGGRGGRRN